MNALNELLGGLFLMLLTIVLGMLVTVLQIHIVYDIAMTYNMFVITLIPVHVMYGLVFILMFLKRISFEKDADNTNDMVASFTKSLDKLAKHCAYYLLGWAIAICFYKLVF